MKREPPQLPLVNPRLSFRRVLETLELAGVAVDDRPHHLLFVITYPEEDLVRQAAEFLDRVHERAFGQQQSGGRSVQRIAERTWQLIIGAHMALKAEVFEPMETVARRLAEMYGGIYEGWRDETGFGGKAATASVMALLAMNHGEA